MKKKQTFFTSNTRIEAISNQNIRNRDKKKRPKHCSRNFYSFVLILFAISPKFIYIKNWGVYIHTYSSGEILLIPAARGSRV